MQRSQSFSQIQALDNFIPIQFFQNEEYVEKETIEQKTIFQQSFALHTKQCQTPLQKYQNYALCNTIIKQGVVQVKLNSGSFNKTKILLTREKLVLLEDKEWNIVYNLKHLAYNLVQCQKNSHKLFKLEFKQFNKVIVIKCSDEIEGKLWFQCIKMIEDKFRNEIEKLFIKEIYFGLDFVRETDFLSWAETGDVLLFETDHYMAKLQRGITGSKYDHVGMVVRKKLENEILVYDVKNQIGVDFEFWYYFIKTHTLYKKIAIRKLLNVDRQFIDEKIQLFFDQVIGQDFDLNIKKLLQQQSDGLINRGYFCSELVAKAYKYCDLLPQKKASSQYWPVTFSKELKLQNDAYLSEPMTILLENDIYYQI